MDAGQRYTSALFMSVVFSNAASVSPASPQLLCASESQSYGARRKPIHRVWTLLRLLLALLMRLTLPFSLFWQCRTVKLLSTVLVYALPNGKKRRQWLPCTMADVKADKISTTERESESKRALSVVGRGNCIQCAVHGMGKLQTAVSSMLVPIQKVLSVVTEKSHDGSIGTSGSSVYDLIVVQNTQSQCLSLSDMCVIPLEDQTALSTVGERKVWPVRLMVWMWIMFYAWCDFVLNGLWQTLELRRIKSIDRCEGSDCAHSQEEDGV